MKTLGYKIGSDYLIANTQRFTKLDNDHLLQNLGFGKKSDVIRELKKKHRHTHKILLKKVYQKLQKKKKKSPSNL